MIVIAIIPLIAAIVGLLMYVLAANAKVAEIGRIIFWTALLVVWFAVAGRTVRVG